MKLSYNGKIRGILSLAIVVIILLPLPAREGYREFFPPSHIDPPVARFEEKQSRSAAIIMHGATGEVVYVYNRKAALEHRYPPGSLAKVWSAVVLMENRKDFSFSPEVPVTCPGRFSPGIEAAFTEKDLSSFNLHRDDGGPFYFNCSLRGGHGNVNLHRALVDSCNVYFLTRSCRHPRNFFNCLINTWHLHEKTSARMVSTREREMEEVPGATPFRLCAGAIGEGGLLRVSPLQVAVTFAAFFERSSILSPFEYPYRDRKEMYPLSVSDETYRLVASSLRENLVSGTLRALTVKNPNVEMLAGKTGTATHAGRKYRTHGWNVIWFGYRGERYILVSFVDLGSGSGAAGELSHIILEALR